MCVIFYSPTQPDYNEKIIIMMPYLYGWRGTLREDMLQRGRSTPCPSRLRVGETECASRTTSFGRSFGVGLDDEHGSTVATNGPAPQERYEL